MNILMINNFLFPVGGVEKYTFSLGNQLEKLGHDVQYFGMIDKRNIVGNRFGIYKSNVDYKKIDFRILKYPFTIIYSIESRRKIRKLVKLFKPDIVHLNTINYIITPSIISLLKNLNIPIVKTIHDPQIACPNHRLFIEHKSKPCTKCITGNYFNCALNKCIKNSRSKSILGMVEGYLYRFLKTYHLIDQFIVPSHFMIEVHKKNGIPENKMSFIRNFSSSTISINDNSFKKNINNKYILYFGRISIEKGIKTLVSAIKELPNIKFVFVGSGPLSAELNNISNIDYLGYKEGKELNDIIRGAVFSVCPSIWYENNPLSILESQALGTPVLGADIGGIPEIINHNNGMLFETGNILDLISKIKALYYDDILLEKMSNYCLSNSTKLNEILYTEKLLKIYESLISTKLLKLSKP